MCLEHSIYSDFCQLLYCFLFTYSITCQPVYGCYLLFSQHDGHEHAQRTRQIVIVSMVFSLAQPVILNFKVPKSFYFVCVCVCACLFVFKTILCIQAIITYYLVLRPSQIMQFTIDKSVIQILFS